MSYNLNYAIQEGYLIVTKMDKDSAKLMIEDILRYYPNMSEFVDNYTRISQFNSFYFKIKNDYPKIFLTDMYGVNFLWDCIESYHKRAIEHDINIKEAILKTHEIISHLYMMMPAMRTIDEMPTIETKEKIMNSVIEKSIKEITKDETRKKAESALALAKDVIDILDAEDVKNYYKTLKKQLEKEYLLKGGNQCEFEKILYIKCLKELEKCDVSLTHSAISGADNVMEIVNQ